MSLEEDEGIQQLDQREEKVNTTVQCLKKRKKQMLISMRMKARAGNKKPTSRTKGGPNGEATTTGLVGAIIGRIQENDQILRSSEKSG
jgi:hypothetical protein